MEPAVNGHAAAGRGGDKDDHDDKDREREGKEAGTSPSAASGEDEVIEKSPQGTYARYAKLIGKGSFKSVYRAQDLENGNYVAWNEVKIGMYDSRDRKRILNEVSLLRRLHHANLIGFYGAWVNKEEEKVVFITELMSSGTLREFCARYPIAVKQVKRYCKDILECMRYLHRPEAAAAKPVVIHRDLKCDNIFIQGAKIKIGDLGLATSDGKTVLGTPEFMAPEMFDNNGYGTSVDVYAFGLCVLEMVTGRTPYSECSGVGQVCLKVMHGELPENIRVLEAAWPEAHAFVLECLTPRMIIEPEGEGGDADAAHPGGDVAGSHHLPKRIYVRPSAAELCEHPFLTELPEDVRTTEQVRSDAAARGFPVVSSERDEARRRDLPPPRVAHVPVTHMTATAAAAYVVTGAGGGIAPSGRVLQTAGVEGATAAAAAASSVTPAPAATAAAAPAAEAASDPAPHVHASEDSTGGPASHVSGGTSAGGNENPTHVASPPAVAAAPPPAAHDSTGGAAHAQAVAAGQVGGGGASAGSGESENTGLGPSPAPAPPQRTPAATLTEDPSLDAHSHGTGGAVETAGDDGETGGPSTHVRPSGSGTGGVDTDTGVIALEHALTLTHTDGHAAAAPHVSPPVARPVVDTPLAPVRINARAPALPASASAPTHMSTAPVSSSVGATARTGGTPAHSRGFAPLHHAHTRVATHTGAHASSHGHSSTTGSGTGGGITLERVADEVRDIRHTVHALYVMMEWMVQRTDEGEAWLRERREKVKAAKATHAPHTRPRESSGTADAAAPAPASAAASSTRSSATAGTVTSTRGIPQPARRTISTMGSSSSPVRGAGLARNRASGHAGSSTPVNANGSSSRMEDYMSGNESDDESEGMAEHPSDADGAARAPLARATEGEEDEDDPHTHDDAAAVAVTTATAAVTASAMHAAVSVTTARSATVSSSAHDAVTSTTAASAPVAVAIPDASLEGLSHVQRSAMVDLERQRREFLSAHEEEVANEAARHDKVFAHIHKQRAIEEGKIRTHSGDDAVNTSMRERSARQVEILKAQEVDETSKHAATAAELAASYTSKMKQFAAKEKEIRGKAAAAVPAHVAAGSDNGGGSVRRAASMVDAHAAEIAEHAVGVHTPHLPSAIALDAARPHSHTYSAAPTQHRPPLPTMFHPT